MNRSQKKIGEILIEQGYITLEQLESGLMEQARTKEFLGAVLIRLGYIQEQDLLDALSEQFNIPVVRIKDIAIDWDFVRSFSAALIFEHKCFPLKKDDWTITFAITNPLDVWALKKCEEESGGLKLKLALVSQREMQGIQEEYKCFLREKRTV